MINQKAFAAMSVWCILLLIGGMAMAAEVVGTLRTDETTKSDLKGTVPDHVRVLGDNGGDSAKRVLKFDGEGHVKIEDTALNFPKSFTIEFDVIFDTRTGDPYLVSKRSQKAGDTASGYWIEFTEGHWLSFTAADGTARGEFVPKVGQSYHVVAVHQANDNGKGQNLLYVDGMQKGAAACNAVAPANDATLTLGDYAGLYHAFRGTLKGVRLSAMAEIPKSNQPAAAPLSESVIGERDTLLNLLNDVQSMLQTRELSDARTEQALGDLHAKLEDPALTLDRIESTREELGKIVGAAAGKQFPRRDFVIWQRTRWADVAPHEWPASNDRPPAKLPVSMAREAYGSQAIVVTNTRDVASDIELSIESPDNAPQVNLRRAWQIACPDRKYRPDPLALISDHRLSLLPGETTLLWFEVDSHGAQPGQYAMPVTLKSSGTTAKVELDVEVADVTMPRILDSKLCNFSYLQEMGWIRDCKDAALEDLQAHYINTYICDIEPTGKADPQGNLVEPVDFSALDRKIELYRDKAALLGFFWKGDIHHNLPLFPELKFMSDPWKKAVVAWYGQLLGHLDQIGLKPNQYFMYVYDETSKPEVQQIYAMLKKEAPNVRLLLNPTTGYKPDEVRQIAPYVDIWMPSFESLVSPHPEDFQFIKSTGKTVWTYSCANGTPMPTYDYNLRRHWVAWDLGITGVAQWAYADRGGWKGTNSWEFVIGAFAMVYAQPHAPKALKLTETLTPSRRWEAWRQGSEDYQLLNMAKQAAGHSPEAQAKLKQVVSAVVSQPDDLDGADKARVVLLHMIANNH